VNPRIKLKLARVEHNLTQAELAEKVGVTRALDKTLNDLFWEESEHEE